MTLGQVSKRGQYLFFVLEILVETGKQPGPGHLAGNLRVPMQPIGGFLDTIKILDRILKDAPCLLGGHRSLRIRHDEPVLMLAL